MSRSNNTEVTNPALRFYKWDGEKGGFQYFDKSLGEKGERVHIDLPFRFMVLDRLATMKGYNDAEQAGFWSNEVRNSKTDELIVRTKSGICFKGLYRDALASGSCNGAKFCQSVYIAVKEGNELIICNIGFVGIALSAWIEFSKKGKIFEGAIEVASMIEGKKGRVTFQTPVFSKIEASPETDAQAKRLDEELQKYLSAYLKNNSQKVADAHVAETVTGGAPEIPDDGLVPPPETEPEDDGMPF